MEIITMPLAKNQTNKKQKKTNKKPKPVAMSIASSQIVS